MSDDGGRTREATDAAVEQLLALADDARRAVREGDTARVTMLYEDVRARADEARGPLRALYEVAEAFLRALVPGACSSETLALVHFVERSPEAAAFLAAAASASGVSLEQRDRLPDELVECARDLESRGVLVVGGDRLTVRPGIRPAARELAVPSLLRRWQAEGARVAAYLADAKHGVSAEQQLDAARRGVVQEPDEDEPRAAFARVLRERGGSARANLIEAQLRIAKKAREPGDSTRVRSWLATYGPDWAEQDLGDTLFKRIGGKWRRGFLEWVELDAATFVAHAPELFDRVPVRGVRITSLENSSVAELREVEELGRLRALSLRDLGIDDTGARALASAPILTGLRWLDLSGNAIGDEGVRALIASPHLRNAFWVGLRDNTSRLLPRPGGREGNLILDTHWSEELLRRDDLPAWVDRHAEPDDPRWFDE